MLSVCYVTTTTVIANSIKKDFFNTCCSSRAQSNFVLIVSAKWSFIKLSTLILLPEQYFSYLMMLLTFQNVWLFLRNVALYTCPITFLRIFIRAFSSGLHMFFSIEARSQIWKGPDGFKPYLTHYFTKQPLKKGLNQETNNSWQHMQRYFHL